jgi:phytoene dehydrogenase-like protein
LLLRQIEVQDEIRRHHDRRWAGRLDGRHHGGERGRKTLLLEKHVTVGGLAAGFTRKGYYFDAGMSRCGEIHYGCRVVKVKIETSYPFRKDLVKDRERYDAEKERIAREVINCLDERFPGFSGQVEMVDVASPVTFERYTGNWQAIYEGFLPTPNSVRVAIPNTLPSLRNLMAGQWVRSGGGIPTGIGMGREAVRLICKQDRASSVNSRSSRKRTHTGRSFPGGSA